MFIHQWYNVELWHEVKNEFLSVFKLLTCYCWDLGTVNQYSQVFSEFSKVLYFNILLRFFTLSNLTSWDSCVEMFLCVQRATLWGVFWKSSSPASLAVPYTALVMLTFKPRLYCGHVTNALNVCFPKFDLVHTLDTLTLTWSWTFPPPANLPWFHFPPLSSSHLLLLSVSLWTAYVRTSWIFPLTNPFLKIDLHDLRCTDQAFTDNRSQRNWF